MEGWSLVIEKAQKIHEERFMFKQYNWYYYLPVGETEFAPIAANVTRFCMFTELTTEKHTNILTKKRNRMFK